MKATQQPLKVNTITAAINFGFKFEDLDQDLTLSEVEVIIKEFICDHSEKIEVIEEHECEVNSSGRSQNVSFLDFTSSGEIIDWSAYRYQPRQKIYHSDFVTYHENGTPIFVKLWCWSCDEEEA